MELIIAVVLIGIAGYFAYQVANGSSPIDDAKKAADVNKDGKLDGKDVSAAAKKVRTRAKRVVEKEVEKAKTTRSRKKQ